MIIDVHGHIGRLNFSPIWTADAAKLEGMLEWAGVDFCIVSSAKALIYDVHEGDREVVEAVERYPRILGYIVGNPTYPEESLRDLAAVAGNPRLVGCKMHPDYHGYDVDSKECYRFVEKVARHVKLFLFHTSVMAATNFAAAHKILGLAKEHPETKFILGHAAGIHLSPLYPYHPDYATSIDMIGDAGLSNVYIDLANGMIFSYPTVFETVVEKLGAERILFASDVPIVRASYLKAEVQQVRDMNITDHAKEQILGLTL